jgi:hypothetical protein
MATKSKEWKLFTKIVRYEHSVTVERFLDRSEESSLLF